MIVMHPDTLESLRTPTNDERMGQWAMRYFSGGYHRMSAAEQPALIDQSSSDTTKEWR